MRTYEEMLLTRKTGLGGTDMAAIAGLNPWITPLDVYLDKTSDTIKNDKRKCLQEGRDLESFVLDQYRNKHNVELETDLETIRDKEYPFLIANLDARVKDKNVVVEAKTTRQRWEELPIQYTYQVAHYASITNADYVDIASWNILTRKYSEYTYFRDKDLENSIKEAAINFWHKHVLAKVPPEPLRVSDAKRLYNRSNNMNILADDCIKAVLKEMNYLKSEKKNLDIRISQCEASILKFIKDNEAIIDERNNFLVTYRNQIANRFDQTKFKEENEELANKYTKQIQSRILRIC